MQKHWWHKATVYQIYPKSLWIQMVMELVISKALRVNWIICKVRGYGYLAISSL